VALAIAGLLRQADSEVFDLVHYEGLSHILAQPEFENSRDVLPLVRVLEHRPALARLLSEATAAPGIRVIIGAEQPIEEMREASAVMTTYGQQSGAQGVLGVLGPRRMPYWRAVAMVRFMASVMSLLVREAWSRQRRDSPTT
jgi:heat-inducible transcriptional repressor